MSNLYKVYYGEIIPGGIKVYESISGKAYSFDENKEKSSLWYKIKKLFSRKPKLPMYLEKAH